MKPSYTFDPKFYEPDSVAAQGLCSQHQRDGVDPDGCMREAVVSFQDRDDRWQSGCSLALEQLVESGEIEPLGEGA